MAEEVQIGVALRKTRALISTMQGQSEFAVVANNEMLKNIFDQMQSLREEMNDAKRLAAKQAAEPYEAQIVELERIYATILRLSSGQ